VLRAAAAAALLAVTEALRRIPGKVGPDMGNVSADGRTLWPSGRYDREVYVLSTDDGHPIRRIPVGDGPRGLCMWPQPGRYSLGHTGITR
jgi:hypothetical protein